MFELSIFIPLRDNDDQLFSEADHAAFESFVLERFGGLTRGGLVEGLWVDQANALTYRDTNVTYVVAVPSITAASRVSEIVAFAKAHYRQEAVYIRYLGLAEVL